MPLRKRTKGILGFATCWPPVYLVGLLVMVAVTPIMPAPEPTAGSAE